MAAETRAPRTRLNQALTVASGAYIRPVPESTANERTGMPRSPINLASPITWSTSYRLPAPSVPYSVEGAVHTGRQVSWKARLAPV